MANTLLNLRGFFTAFSEEIAIYLALLLCKNSHIRGVICFILPTGHNSKKIQRNQIIMSLMRYGALRK